MDDVKLILMSEISNIVYKAKAVIKDHETEIAAICEAIEEVSFLLFKSGETPSSPVVSSHPEQARMIFVNEHYVAFGEYFVENFNAKWLESDTDNGCGGNRVIHLFDRYFLCGPEEESFILLCHAISFAHLRVVCIHCVQLLEDLLKKSCMTKILEQYCCGCGVQMARGKSDTELARSPQWQTLMSTVCSLPDVVAAKTSSLEAGMFFLPPSYIPLIGGEILAVMQTVYARLQNGVDSSVTFLALLAGKISLCGYAELLLRSLIPELQHLCATDFLWLRIAQRFFGGIPDRCLESVVLQLVVMVPSPHLLGAFLGNMPQTSPKLAYLLSHKLLLVRCFDGPVAVCVLRNIVGYLANNVELSVLFMSTFRSLLATWADGSSLRHRPLEQSVYLSKAVVAFIAYASPQAIAESREDILRCMLDGVPSYLGSSVTTVRQIGSVVGEKLSDAVHRENESEPLRFNVEKNDIVDSVLELCNIPASEVNTSIDTGEKTLDDESEVVTETVNNLSLQSKETCAGKCEEELDSDDEAAELKPYSVFASEPENAKKPVYLAQCIDGLIKQDDPESVEQSLIHVESLVRRGNLSTVHEVGIELCRILLHLDDRFALVSFTVMRFRALVSLAVTVPALIAEYLGAEFYGRNYNIRQRMDVLDVLATAATELAEPPKTTSGASATGQNTSVVQATENTSHHVNWVDVVQQRIEAKTRRFSKGRRCPPRASAANRFAGIAGSFFYPLLRHFDHRSDSCLDLLGHDHLVFERLIYTLGTVMLAATGTPDVGRMLTALLEFLRCSRHHVEAGVRRANLYAVCASLTSMPSTAVLDDPAAFSDLGDWLQNVLRHDADVECRHRAAQALQLLNAAVKHVSE